MLNTPWLPAFGLSASLLLAGACGSSGSPDNPPGSKVTTTEAVPDDLAQALAAAKTMDGAGLSQAYPAVTGVLGYDTNTAKGMDLLQASALKLNDSELAALAKHGVVISARQKFPSFAYGYRSIYAEDLPVYISADSILEAVHRSFDVLLQKNEEAVLVPELINLLDGMRARLATAGLDAQVAKDADLYLALAASLLKGQQVAPVAGADAGQIASLLSLATAASGHKQVNLFGVTRDEDFSQFTPRGHYVNTPALGRYFKAMMWLGRVDLRIVETQSDGTQVFHRRQFEAALALHDLLDATEFERWQRIDNIIGAYAGEHDNMTPKDLDGLLKALQVTSLASSQALTDEQIVDELARGAWGAQRIASRIIIKDVDGPTLPLDRSFALFGQRYTVDSHTFVNVTYDRVSSTPKRMMPKPLDAAFAALADNAALPLLSAEFGSSSYVQGLAKTRALVDAHEPAYWSSSLYTRWLDALRSLSNPDPAALAGITRTPGWDQRILSAQLASWAELRRDTILYVKQSYSGGNSCEFPDAYVDPYPEFYAKLGSLADAVGATAQDLPDTLELKKTMADWVTNFQVAMANLKQMAEDQRAGTPHSAELLAFINEAVKWDEQSICGGISRTNLSGWYLKLFLNQWAGIEYAPVVADVHTQPTDEAGADVGRILHVGTGPARLMVVTANTCQGPRAYAGLAFSYGELITENWKRLNDRDWEATIAGAFPDASWMSDVVAR